MRASVFRAGLLLFLVGCSGSNTDPVFESTELAEVSVKGGDCAEHRCVQVIAPVIGSREGKGSCELFGPGDPDELEPLATSGELEMIPDQETVWEVELPHDGPDFEDLNPVCNPTAEG